MKYLLLIAAILLSSCSGNKNNTTADTSVLKFNSFPIGTPLDTLVKKSIGKPTLQSEDQLLYNNVSAEGVTWNTITYDFIDRKLARVIANRPSQDVATYQKLVQSLNTRYGKPARNVDSLILWSRWYAELSLQPGTIMFSRR